MTTRVEIYGPVNFEFGPADHKVGVKNAPRFDDKLWAGIVPVRQTAHLKISSQLDPSEEYDLLIIDHAENALVLVGHGVVREVTDRGVKYSIEHELYIKRVKTKPKRIEVGPAFLDVYYSHNRRR